MYRVFEVIEVLPNGSRQTVTVASSLESAKARLEDLAKHTQDECLAVECKDPPNCDADERQHSKAESEEGVSDCLRRGTSASKDRTPKVAGL